MSIQLFLYIEMLLTMYVFAFMSLKKLLNVTASLILLEVVMKHLIYK
jgi:hypothetical protein